MKYFYAAVSIVASVALVAPYIFVVLSVAANS